jgi:hypothetical protein
MATRAKPHGFGDWRAAVSRAPGLQVGEPEGGRFGGDGGAADVLGW